MHAWGATLALAGTGRPPYGTGRPEAVLYRVVHAEPDLDGLPPALLDLVVAALAKDPRARPTTAQLLAGLGVRDLVGASSGSYAVQRDTTVLRAVPPQESMTVLRALRPPGPVDETTVLGRPHPDGPGRPALAGGVAVALAAQSDDAQVLAGAVVGGTVAALVRGRARDSRRLLRLGSARLVPTPGAAVIAACVLLLLAAGLAVAVASATTRWWPLLDSPLG